MSAGRALVAQADALRPYFAADGVTLYHAEARALLTGLADDTAQLILTDPPYNVGIPYPGYSDWLDWPDYWALADGVLTEAGRVLRPGGVLALLLPFTAARSRTGGRLRGDPGWSYDRSRAELPVPLLAEWTARASAAGLLYGDTVAVAQSLTGDGDGTAVGMGIGSPARPRMRTVARALLVCHAGRISVPGRAGAFTRDLLLDDCKNHWYVRPAWGQGNGHPTPMPPLVAERAMRLWSNPGDLLVDPFCGSGVVVDVARRGGRRVIGGDVAEASCAITRARIAQEVLAL